MAVILALHFLTGQHRVLPLRPQSIHQWSQCDRGAVAKNYARYDMNLFLPRVQNIDNGTGITGMEFPFVNYSVAILYKCFGYHEWLYRLFTLVLYSFGLYFVFRIAYFFTEHFASSLGIMTLFASSPLLVYYAANFLCEPSALACALAAWYFLIRYRREERKIWLNAWFIGITLAGLTKISALISLPAMCLYFWLEKDKTLNWKVLLPLAWRAAVASLLVMAWYRYAIWLSEHTQSAVFLLKSMPPRDWNEVKDVWNEISIRWGEYIYQGYLLASLPILALLLGILRHRYIGRVALITLALLLGVAAFSYGMWTQFRYHDYYLITLYPFILLMLITIVCGIRSFNHKLLSGVLTVGLFGLSGWHLLRANERQARCYDKSSDMYSAIHFDDYFSLNPILRANGVKDEDRIISVYDHTPGISLYLMDQFGVSVSYRQRDTLFENYFNSGNFKFVLYDVASNYEGSTFDYKRYPLDSVWSDGNLYLFRVKQDYVFPHPTPGIGCNLSPWD